MVLKTLAIRVFFPLKLVILGLAILVHHPIGVKPQDQRIVRFNKEPIDFLDVHYHDLDVNRKDEYVIVEIEQVSTHFHCLKECYYEKYRCQFSYFIQSVCFVCNQTAQDFFIDFRDSPGKSKTNGRLFKRIT